MSTITELVQRMKLAASLATQGEWSYARSGFNSIVQAPVALLRGGPARAVLCKLFRSEWRSELNTAHDAAFIALANPTNVLALVEALEKAQGMEDYWKTQCRGIADHREKLQAQIEQWEKLNAQFCSNADADISALRQRIAELESRTISMKQPLPRRKTADDYVDDTFDPSDMAAVYNACRLECEVKFKNALAAVGIQVIEGDA
ncbi:TPA: ead/Ea22-like family protein [Citrobacter freundii]|nr:hypothetical protein [Citrobacter freundii]HAT2362560.1 hypothetical protein [Citrobacter freundii]HCD1220519.1 ead/Ea22-like family protein [Citrobacter freundii]HCD1225798.1 ead/Ea22-like family protein [Citrobacter freundii]HCD1247460.1 ead/Ea22-like family protein [Citrobacter freundii]